MHYKYNIHYNYNILFYIGIKKKKTINSYSVYTISNYQYPLILYH